MVAPNIIRVLTTETASRVQQTFEFTGDGSAVSFDIPKVLQADADVLAFYGGVPVDLADITVTPDTPAAGQSRIAFGFTPANGEKIKIRA